MISDPEILSGTKLQDSVTMNVVNTDDKRPAPIDSLSSLHYNGAFKIHSCRRP